MCYDTSTLCNAVNINPKLVMYTDSVLYIKYTESGGGTPINLSLHRYPQGALSWEQRGQGGQVLHHRGR